MKFIKYTQTPEGNDFDCRAYPIWLEKNRHRMPSGALALAAAPWHYDPSDHRCLHDSRLERLAVTARIGKGTTLSLRLLAPYGGITVLRYADVSSYTIRQKDSVESDWLIDEIRLTPTGEVIHEIAFTTGSLLIHCRDLTCHFHPHASSSEETFSAS